MTAHANYKASTELKNLSLGKATDYQDTYNPNLLQGVPRALNRDDLQLAQGALPFKGEDIWNMYELSWLNNKGKPVVATAVAVFSCETELLVESKSFKLYLNSFNQTRFESVAQVQAVLEKDLSVCAQGKVKVSINTAMQAPAKLQDFSGLLLDDLDIEVEQYQFQAQLLADALVNDAEQVEEQLVSHLLKSNCLVTHQPDWASVQIYYKGPKISHEHLLRYIISFRQHNEFHEQCVERIYMDIMRFCKPDLLQVYARYTRRGGLDINPWRSNFNSQIANVRLIRQ